MSYASYNNPWTSNIIIPGWISSSECVWVTPCYNQFQTIYNWEICSNWCSPTAVWIIFWYYDRNWFPNLIPWTATLTNSYFVNTMISEVSNIIWTKCSWTQWTTILSNVKNAKQYAINKWYKNSTSSYSWNINTLQVFNEVKSEINLWRPILIHILNNSSWWWHAVVWFWYRSTWTTKIVRVNMWWGGSSKYWNYYLSNIDQNLDSVYYNGDNNKIARWVTKFNISN